MTLGLLGKESSFIQLPRTIVGMARGHMIRLNTRPGSTMAEIELEGVWKVYADGTEAVKDLTITVGDGEFVVFVGPSGCGKTTALRMIAGLEEISAGKIRIADRVVNDVPARDRDVAMVFQNYALYPHLTVRENIDLGSNFARWTGPS